MGLYKQRHTGLLTSGQADGQYVQSFNGRFRAECLNAQWFMSHADAGEKLENWRKDYNEYRSHGAIGYKVPMDLMKSECAFSPSV